MQILLSDLVTLRERGTFSGLMALSVSLLYLCFRKPADVFSSWAVGGGIGPALGGLLAQSENWYVLRW